MLGPETNMYIYVSNLDPSKMESLGEITKLRSIYPWFLQTYLRVPIMAEKYRRFCTCIFRWWLTLYKVVKVGKS